MLANLDGVREKIRRANEHFAKFNESVRQWGTSENKTDPFSIHNDRERKTLIVAHKEVSANNPDWPLLAGDIVHNLRSSLDHLVCQLAILNGNDISCCNRTYFPVCICTSDFGKARKFIEPLIVAEAFTEIENLQPYKAAAQTGLNPKHNTLWIINDLDIIDKHRLMVVVGKYFRSVDLSYAFNDAHPINAPVEGTWKPLKAGAEIGRIDYSAQPHGPNDKVRVQGTTQAQVFITEFGFSGDALEAVDTLLKCIRRTEEIVNFFQARFFR
jgi:hypothetical protein